MEEELSETEKKTLKTLRHKRGYQKGCLTSLESELAALTTPDEGILENFLKIVDGIVLKFDVHQTALEDNFDFELDTNERSEFDTRVRTFTGLVRSKLCALKSGASTPVVAAQVKPIFAVQKLAKLPPPTFSGERKDWISFKKSITRFLETEELDDTIKYQYLENAVKDAVTPKPLRLVQSAESEYLTAWSNLTLEYDNDVILKNDLVAELYDVQTPKQDCATSLQHFIDTVEMSVTQLKSISEDVASSELLFVYHLITKLDFATQKELEKIKKTDSLLTYKDLMKFLKNRVQILENVAKLEKLRFDPQSASTPLPKGNKNVPPPSKKTVAAVIEQNKSPRQSCVVCNEIHHIMACETFKNMNPQQRLDKARSLKLCFNCLKGDHLSPACPDIRRCKNCNKKHHTLLHNGRQTTASAQAHESTPASATPSAETAASQTAAVAQIATPVRSQTTVILATAVVCIEDIFGQPVSCRAFLDSGSTVSFITEELVNRLGLKRKTFKTTIHGVNDKESTCNHLVTSVVSSRLSKYSTLQEFVVTRKIVGDLPIQKITTKEFQLPPVEQLADPEFGSPAKVDILLGAEVFFEILTGAKCKISDNLWRYPSEFGDIIAGGFGKSNIQHSYTAIDELKSLIQRFWECEIVGLKTNWSVEERQAENHYVEHVKHRDDNHYELALPFNEKKSLLGQTDHMAKKLFLFNETRRIRFPDKNEAYRKVMQELIEMGHMELVENVPNDGCYLTHHMVTKLESLSTKYRVVFDASKPTSSGVALNDTLLIGPSIQAEIFCHLIRWREFAIGITSDIAKMYRMIYIRPEDRKYQMIFWRNSQQEELQTYQLTTVTFGTSSAPFQAIRTLKQLAIDNQILHPEASSKFENNFSVDDYVDSVESVEKAHLTKSQMIDLAGKGGFKLTKWTSNCANLEDESMKSQAKVNILGVPWVKDSDMIYVDFSHIKIHEKISRSTILSEIAQLFDPLGLAAPVVLKAKTIMQELWQIANVSWTDELPEEFVDKWHEFRVEISNMQPLSNKRALIPHEETKYSIHGFADASTVGYGACLYLTTATSSVLICAKSRVAPLRRLTIPRLELNAALLLATLSDRIKNSLRSTPEEEFYWTDSEITLFRIRSHPSKFNLYVGTRISEIQRLTPVESWNFIPTKLNPADILSRGCMPNDLMDHELWWHGPDFLLGPRENWPNQQKFRRQDLVDEELKQIVAKVELPPSFASTFDKFSSWDRLVGTIAHVIRFRLNAIKPKKYRNVGEITLQELDEATKRIIRIVQQEAYPQELKTLNKKKQIVNSKILVLNPFLDEDGLLRVGGRLRNLDVQYDEQHQIIIPRGNVGKLILRKIHQQNLHCGPQLMLSTSRQKYWVIGARSTSRRIVHECLICFRQRPQLMNQIMADLPRQRLFETRPFLRSGIDFAGPFFVRPYPRAKSTVKVYICLFTCFVTRCTHLELVRDLTSQAFLASLRKFIARRGRPNEIWSDNATNFVGASRELEELRVMLMDSTTNAEIQAFCRENRIIWKRIPPRSPHFGGLWESSIKQMKTHLKKVSKDLIYTFETLETVVCQIEAIMNSRPLTPITANPEDFETLTPSHFLIGAPLNSFPEPSWIGRNFNRLELWQQRQQLVGQLWEKFRKDYLQQLQTRNKWNFENPNLHEGQMVLVAEDNTPPGVWKIGRVVAVIPSRDGKIRVARILTNGGEFERPIVKLALLPFEDNI